MARKYILSAVLLIGLSAFTSGQQDLKTHLEIQVTDVTGAPVPNARVEVTSHGAAAFAAIGKTDNRGTISFDLVQADYKLMVVSRGFYFKEMPFTVTQTPKQTIPAVLQIESCPGPGHPACITVEPLPDVSTSTQQPHRIDFMAFDTTGEPITGAQIEITSQTNEAKLNTVTGQGGEAELTLPPGKYAVAITHRLFEPWKSEIKIEGHSQQIIKATMNVDCHRVICDVQIDSNPASLTPLQHEEANDLSTLTLTVQDQSSAIILGARIRVVEQTTKAQFDTVIGETGQAELHLPPGIYTLRVQAPGFATWVQTDFEPKPQTRLPVTLKVANCSPCLTVSVEPILMPQDDASSNNPAVTTELPSVPLQLLSLRAKRLRLRPHA